MFTRSWDKLNLVNTKSDWKRPIAGQTPFIRVEYAFLIYGKFLKVAEEMFVLGIITDNFKFGRRLYVLIEVEGDPSEREHIG